jgi:4-hydroxy-tetrahydrodipicolinate synthase
VKTPRLTGLHVACATPFDASGGVDLKAYGRLVARLLGEGVDVIVALGSTGEAATLDDDERDRILEAAVAAARGKPVVAGCGTNDTKTTAALMKRARARGASAALVVTPYYNKPTPDGIVAHFRAAADAAPDLPIVAYNVPGRTGTNMKPSTIARLWEIPQVVALKESSGDLAQIAEIARTLPPTKLLLAGDDQLALASIAVGARGLVSVAGNVVPSAMKALVDAALHGRLDEARAHNARLLPLMDALFLESNPIPTKAALAWQRLSHAKPRLPLTEATAATKARLAALLEALPEAKVDAAPQADRTEAKNGGEAS